MRTRRSETFQNILLVLFSRIFDGELSDVRAHFLVMCAHGNTGEPLLIWLEAHRLWA